MDIFALGLKQEHLESLEDASALDRVGRVVADPLCVWHDGEERQVTARANVHGVVGDFVVLEDGDRVVQVLTRLTVLKRRSAGGGSGEQTLAANVDIVGVLEPLDHKPNLRRIERGITLAYAAGADPLVVLTKADTLDDVGRAVEDVREVAGAATIVAVSATEGTCVDDVRAALPAGSTVVLIGASGAGKSTLLNALMGHEVAKTSDVRSFDKKGRHTTASRHLFQLPWGAMLIDTPGTRELGLIVDDDALDTSFADVAALAKSCRYRDCVHEAEPGCALQQAVLDGTLSAGRLAGYQKQRKEMRWLEERQQGSNHEQRARGKRFGKMVKEMKRVKRKP